MYEISRSLLSAARASSAALVVILGCLATSACAAESLGDFEAHTDIGTVTPAGKTTYDAAKKEYRITSAGENIWAKHDDFHFLHRRVTGDVVLSADITLAGEGKNAHRKAGLMIRQDLDADSAYVDVVVHGDGHIGLQYRTVKGEITKDIKSEVKTPATVRIERKGETITAYATAKQDEKSAQAAKPEEKRIGEVKLAMKAPTYAGLAVTSHDAKESETAVFSKVMVKTEPAAKAEPGK